jgi:hypothetical protein
LFKTYLSSGFYFDGVFDVDFMDYGLRTNGSNGFKTWDLPVMSSGSVRSAHLW